MMPFRVDHILQLDLTSQRAQRASYPTCIAQPCKYRCNGNFNEHSKQSIDFRSYVIQDFYCIEMSFSHPFPFRGFLSRASLR